MLDKAQQQGPRSFKGVMLDVSRTNLSSNEFQEDQGSDRFKRGSWRRRRGMLHSDLAAFASPVTAIIGLDLPGVDYAWVLVEGQNIQGNANPAVQTRSSDDPAGFGQGGFGAGGFGA